MDFVEERGENGPVGLPYRRFSHGWGWDPRFGRSGGTGKRIKVTPEQEETIRRLKAEGGKVAAIARVVGLSRPTVYSVIGG